MNMEYANMEYERKGVTITWEVENLKYILRELYSPVISMDAMDGTKWKLRVRFEYTSYISLAIKREAEDNGPDNIELDYEFSVSSFNGKYQTVGKAYSFTFEKDLLGPEVEKRLNYPSDQKTETDLLPDNITIRCKIWKHRGSLSKSCHFFARTGMGKNCDIFHLKIPSFSNISAENGRILKTLQLYGDEMSLDINFYLLETYQVSLLKSVTQISVEFIPAGKIIERFLNFKLFILDSSGNKTELAKFEKKFKLRSYGKFQFPYVSKEYLMENAAQYLTNDTLSLDCEVTFFSSKEFEIIERIEYEADSVAELKQTDFSNEVEFLTSKEGIPPDAKLQTATETFAAHTVILSAKSTIFEALFQGNMKETSEKCIRIEDVDAETMKSLLVFLYSDTLEELEWKDAMKLYFAADKYHLLSLKRKCSAFLKETTDLSNCCVLLLMADTHQDEDLKKAVQEYIYRNVKAVSYCDQWDNLEKDHPYLVIEYFRDQHVEKYRRHLT